MGLTVREIIRFVSGRKWSAPIEAITEHGSYRFEVVAVEGDVEKVVLRLKTIPPEIVQDADGDQWDLQSDQTYAVVVGRGREDARISGVFYGYTYSSLERAYGPLTVLS